MSQMGENQPRRMLAEAQSRVSFCARCRSRHCTLLSSLCQIKKQRILLRRANQPPTLVVGYSAKEQKTTSPMSILTFQWDSVNGETVHLNGMVKPSVAGTAYEHGKSSEFTPGWHLSAPQIQVRCSDGSYTTRYYADDMWDDELCGENSDPDGDGIDGIPGWGDEFGAYDATTTLALGQGAWLKSAGDDCTFTTAGAVADGETAVGGDTTVMILAGGAFPVSFKINSEDATWKLTAGTAYNHGADSNFTPGWHLSAPQIQVRCSDGSYTTRYYADDMWDDELCGENSDPDGDGIDGIAGWGDEFGAYDATTTVEVGGGFWLKQPNGDKKIYVTVKNPVK